MEIGISSVIFRLRRAKWLFAISTSDSEEKESRKIDSLILLYLKKKRKR